MSNQSVPNSNTSSINRSNRIIRSRQGATTAAGWLSSKQNEPTQEQASCSESNIPEFVYLEVSHQSESPTIPNQRKLLKCLRKAATMSTILDDMLNQNELLSGKTENGCPIIPLENPYCAPNAIEQIIQWCEYHCDDPMANVENGQMVSNNGDNNLSTTNYLQHQSVSYQQAQTPHISYRSFDENDEEHDHEAKYEISSYWDRSFIQSIAGQSITAETRGDLYDLMIAAHYLGIDRLVELGAKYICKQITGKNCEEVRALLNIFNDIEPNEERRIHEQNAWISKPSTGSGTNTNTNIDSKK
ncbi:suppressor of kinetochore protein mutant [Blomia tropicalis]|nr:suppressor of kinetochore protein mutant [Blomia tropicalis]